MWLLEGLYAALEAVTANQQQMRGNSTMKPYVITVCQKQYVNEVVLPNVFFFVCYHKVFYRSHSTI